MSSGYVDPQPRFIPGYTGCCPQYRYRANDPHGISHHEVPIEHTEKLVLSDRNIDNFELYRPSQKDKDVMTTRVTYGSSIYQHPMMPGYGGFVPRLDRQYGHTYGVQATEAFSDFEQLQQEDESQKSHLKMSEADTDHMKNLTEDPRINQKKQGADVDLPADYSRFGHTRHPTMNPILCDVNSDYQGKEKTDWAPDSLVHPDQRHHIESEVLYHKGKGMIPNYAGHIPGAAFRCGQTFSEGSQGAKQRMN